MEKIHKIPKNVKGCYAVIFSYQLSNDLEGYADMDQKTIDALVEYVRDMIPNLDSHQLYFDRGTAGLDKSYRDPQIRIDSILEKSSIDFESLVFEGEDHQEKFWAKRFKAWLVKMQERM